jgi:SAM-dependent methyltransferase
MIAKGTSVLGSTVCRYEHFHEEWYLRWAARMQLEPTSEELQRPDRNISRKAWEWCAIAEALHERDMLSERRTGLGFAVGKEPLPSLFAAYGVNVTATDLGDDNGGWTQTNQNAQSVEHLYHPHLVDRVAFDRNVSFRSADMSDLSSFDDESVDFVWSSCSFEHLGTLDNGLRFVRDAMRVVKPGGVAVHTTEFNVSSNDETIQSGGDVIYRKQDIEKLEYSLRGRNSALERLDFYAGAHQYDIDYDYPPYFTHGRKHVKLLLHSYVSTSILLIIRKGSVPST